MNEKVIGKGYSYLFALLLTGLLCLQGFNFEYSKKDGWHLETKDVPTHILIGYLFLVASSLGVNTDSMAIALGNLLNRGGDITPK